MVHKVMMPQLLGDLVTGFQLANGLDLTFGKTVLAKEFKNSPSFLPPFDEEVISPRACSFQIIFQDESEVPSYG